MANTRPEAAQGRRGFIYLKLAGHSPSPGDVRAETQVGMGSRTNRGTRVFGSLTKLMPSQLIQPRTVQGMAPPTVTIKTIPHRNSHVLI